MNTEALRKTAALLRESSSYDQAEWFKVTAGEAPLVVRCQTPACVAGHAIIAAGKRIVRGEIVEDASSILSLTSREANVLFDAVGSSWPSAYAARLREVGIRGPEAAQVAADLCDALADGTVTL